MCYNAEENDGEEEQENYVQNNNEEVLSYEEDDEDDDKPAAKKEEKEETKVLQTTSSTVTTNALQPRIGAFTLDTQTLWLLFGLVGGLLVLIIGILGLASAIAIIAMLLRSCGQKRLSATSKEIVKAGEPAMESVLILDSRN